MITAGPTREPLDPVRYLTNPSSGKMGLELAKELRRRGAAVRLILGPTFLTIPPSLKCIPVTTALEMSRIVRKYLPHSDVFIASAAVSDWRFKKIRSQKMKKGSRTSWSPALIRNPDILKDAGRYKRRHGRPWLIGFALETNDLKKAALKKIKEKNLDLIIANSPDSFSSEKIKPLLVDSSGRVDHYGLLSKKALSKKIAFWLERAISKQK